MRLCEIKKELSCLSDYIFKCAATLIACGIDPAKSILFQQSKVVIKL
jgi:tryptophanyl-tRNA synthetase